MRKVVLLLPLLALAACGPQMRWEKPGATEQAVAADLTECRGAAAQEVNNYPFAYGYYPWAFGPPVWGGYRSHTVWAIRQDGDRAYTENRLRAFCMRNKGYELVPVTPPQTPAPPSPEPPLSK